MNALHEAQQLFTQVICQAGHEKPATYAQLLSIIMPSLPPFAGPTVFWCESFPPCFRGVQIADGLFVNGSPAVSDHERLRILAHEWCHWLRQDQYQRRTTVRMYVISGGPLWYRDSEETVARAFERLF